MKLKKSKNWGMAWSIKIHDEARLKRNHTMPFFIWGFLG